MMTIAADLAGKKSINLTIFLNGAKVKGTFVRGVKFY